MNGEVVRLTSMEAPTVEVSRTAQEREAVGAVHEAEEVCACALARPRIAHTAPVQAAIAKRRRTADGSGAPAAAAAPEAADEGAEASEPTLMERAAPGLRVLAEVMGSEGAARARELIERAGRVDEPEGAGPLVALLPPTPDKAARTRVHMTVREHLPMFVSDTVDAPEGEGAEGKGVFAPASPSRRGCTCTPTPAWGLRSRSPPPGPSPWCRGDEARAGCVATRCRAHLRSTPSPHPRALADAGFDPRGRFRWPDPERQYVHFSLHKTNMDTAFAVERLAQVRNGRGGQARPAVNAPITPPPPSARPSTSSPRSLP